MRLRMSQNWLPEYIQETYGECKLDQCECIKKDDRLRLACSNWVRTTATNWEELLEKAKEKQNGKSICRLG